MGKPRGKKQQMSKQDTALCEKAEKALEYRALGMTYREIASTMQVDGKTAWKYVQRAFKYRTEEIAEKAEQIRQVEVARIEKVIKANMAAALKGDSKASMVILRASERIARMYGLDEMPKHNSSVTVNVHNHERDLEQCQSILERAGFSRN